MKGVTDESFRIAIIGMAGRFPGAVCGDEFWENLRRGKESICFLDKDQLSACGVPYEMSAQPEYIAACASLPDVDMFDADFFGYTAREAETMDPQFRLFLEVCYEAMACAGYGEKADNRRVGVFAGSGISSYLLFNVYPKIGFSRPTDYITNLVGNDKDYLAASVAYKLNLGGPALSINTACSTGLVCLHYACSSLLTGESDMALAGAVSVTFPQWQGYLYQEGSLMSRDGHCRPFDSHASGTVFGDGAGVVLLKRLDDALRDRDEIYAVILGSAVNNDGNGRVGFTAPSLNGQKAVIRESLAVAGVDASTIGYVEAHGTGTQLGDPIEVAALTQAYRMDTKDRGFCALGSVKSNVGHLRSAAAMAGLLKVIYSLRYGEIPPAVNFEQPAEKLNLASSPFFIPDKLMKWNCGNGVRRAAISSFGIGGTNAHAILEAPVFTQHKPRPSAPVFNRKRYWIDPPLPGQQPSSVPEKAAASGSMENIKRIWGQVLGIPPDLIDPEISDFYSLGGSSLQLVEVVERLALETGKDADKHLLLNACTVREMSDVLEQSHISRIKTGKSTGTDYDKEKLLDDDILPQSCGRDSCGQDSGNAVLLTGATGFLGTYILDKLLEDKRRIICLVRCRDEAEALERLKESRRKFRLDEKLSEACVTVVPGDLSKPGLGLDAWTYKYLSAQVGEIFHAGARVSFADTYEELRSSNVDSCREILRFACRGREKTVNYISTLAIFRPGASVEGMRLIEPGQMTTGYERTKWVAEHLFSEARKRGIPVRIYRSGIVGGDTRNGIIGNNGLFWSFLSACIHTKTAPDMAIPVDIVPADFFAGAVVALSQGNATGQYEFNIANPAPDDWEGLISALKALGYEIGVVGYHMWLDTIKSSIAKGGTNPLAPFLGLLADRMPESVTSSVSWYREPTVRSTLTLLENMGLTCPSLSKTLLPLYLEAITRRDTVTGHQQHIPHKSGAPEGKKYRVNSLEQLLEASSPIPARTIQVAAAVKLWDALAQGPADKKELASRLRADERGVAILTDALWALGLVDKAGARYFNTPYAQRHLVSTGSGYHGSWLLLNHSVWEDWQKLKDIVLEGGNGLGEKLFYSNPEKTSLLLEALAQRAYDSAGALVSCLNVREKKGRFLDVGGGFGGFIKGFLEHMPGWSGILFDLPPVCRMAEEKLKEHSAYSRLDIVEGDFHTDELPKCNDIVLLSAIVHGQSGEENRRLIKKARNALKPDGKLVIRDYMPGRNTDEPDQAFIHAVQLLLGSRHGRYYFTEEITEWLREAEFRSVIFPREDRHILVAGL